MPRRTGLGAAAALAVAAVVFLSGCGGAGRDAGGLTAGDRSDIQSALDLLQNTSIPTLVISISATAGVVPTICQVHLAGADAYQLFMFWKPFSTRQAYTWLRGTFSRGSIRDHFHLAYAGGQTAEAALVGKTEGDAFTKPDASCEILKNGYLRLLPSARG